jgi:hypothetical protein
MEKANSSPSNDTDQDEQYYSTGADAPEAVAPTVPLDSTSNVLDPEKQNNAHQSTEPHKTSYHHHI